MPFTLFCLGTDTVYTSGNNYLERDVGIGLQETLSTVAGYILEPTEHYTPILLVDPSLKTNTDVNPLHQSATVLDGPDTTGIVVHDKIAKGLILCLDAMLRGERVINLIGFSRGGVIALHITHELQRIREALNSSEGNAGDIICNTPIQWCKNHLNTNYRENINKKVTLDALNAAFADPFQINIFALDPVPGLCEGSIAAPAAWASDRHYTIPSIVNNFVEIIHEDERSVGFIPIIPQRMQASVDNTASIHCTTTVSHLPGFHGTGDGNPYHHVPKKAITDGVDPIHTRDVQTMVFYRMLQFLNKHGVPLKKQAIETDSLLGSAYDQYIRACEGGHEPIDSLLLQCYTSILGKREHYRKLRDTAYTSKEHIENERKVMAYGNKAPSKLSNSVSIPRSDFINQEHFFLTLAKERSALKSSPDSTQSRLYQLATGLNNFLDKIDNQTQELDLNKLLTHSEQLDQYKIIESLIKQVPATLVEAYLNEQTSPDDLGAIKSSIEKLLDFSLSRSSSASSQLNTLDLQITSLEETKKAVIKRLKFCAMESIQLVITAYLNEANRYTTFNDTNADPINETALDSAKKAADFYSRLTQVNRHYSLLSLAKADSKLNKRTISFPGLYDNIIKDHADYTTILDGLKDTVLGKKLNEIRTVRLGENAPHIIEFKQTIAELQNTLRERTNRLQQLEDGQKQLIEEVAQLTAQLQQAHDQIQLNNQASSEALTQAEQKKTVTPTNTPPYLNGISFQILSGFAAVIGTAAVTLALIMLAVASAGLIIPATLAVSGLLLGSMGFYGFHQGAQSTSQFCQALQSCKAGSY